MQKWEYLTARSMREPKRTGVSDNWLHDWDLDELGKQGWELVGIVPLASWAGEAYAGVTSEVDFIFKRPKET